MANARHHALSRFASELTGQNDKSLCIAKLFIVGQDFPLI